MERDFLGLSSKEPLTVVKEEVVNNSDGFKDIGFLKGSAVHWPFSNRASAFSHSSSFKFSQEDKTKKIGSDPLVSHGFMSISAADAHAPCQKRSMPDTETHKSFNHDRNGGCNLSLTAYPLQHDVHSVHHPHDVKMFPVSNHSISISTGHPFFKNHYATAGQNAACSPMKPQLLGGIPISTSHSILPTVGSVAGLTDSGAKASSSPAQLTIFYAGIVNVFDDISPEKAQAIMFLAGNGSSTSSNTHPKVQVLAPSSKPAATDVSPVNQPITTPPCSRLSSPLSVSSQTGAHSGSGSTNTEEIMTAKTTGVVSPHVSKPEPPKIASSMASVSATTMIPSVPQARKASLARFLEKRKERVMSAAPYNLSKKCPENGT